jgi:hypothetical protein
MRKISGEEPINTFLDDSQNGYVEGMPIRLRIAISLLAANADNESGITNHDAQDAIRGADLLISAYNNIPNPNL